MDTTVFLKLYDILDSFIFELAKLFRRSFSICNVISLLQKLIRSKKGAEVLCAVRRVSWWHTARESPCLVVEIALGQSGEV